MVDTVYNTKSGKGGFESLEALSVSYSGLTGDEFERLIEENEWIRNLKGLEVSGNPELICPSNIDKLTNLSMYDIPYNRPTVWFEGSGLIIKKCPKFKATEEYPQKLVALFQGRKAYLED